MAILVDTNILLRTAEPSSAQHRECVDALQRVTEAKADQVVCAQVLIEFWVAATRPVSVNGLGMGAAEAKATLDDFLRTSRCLTEPPDIAARWKRSSLDIPFSGSPRTMRESWPSWVF